MTSPRMASSAGPGCADCPTPIARDPDWEGRHAVAYRPAAAPAAQKARVLAMLALAKTSDRVEIRRMFLEY